MTSENHDGVVLIRRRSSVLVLATILLVASACGDDGEPTTEAGSGVSSLNADDLDGRSFDATEVTGHELVDGSTVHLAFEDGNVAAIAGCNTMTGRFAIDDGRLTVGELAQTRMACPDDLTTQDEWLSTLLSGGPAIALDGTTLVLSADDTTIRADEDR